MGKFRKGLSFGIAIVGAYLLAEKFYPKQTEHYKNEVGKRFLEAKDEFNVLKDRTIEQGQDFANVAGLASDETRENLAHAQKDVVKSLKELSGKVGKVVSDTKNNLTDLDDNDKVVDTLVKGVTQVKDELTNSFDEILSSFSTLKEGVKETTDAAIELSEEVVSE